MDRQTLFEKQTENVEFLRKVKKNVLQELNAVLKNKKSFHVKYKTLQYAHVYSALSEAELLQILNTPNAFVDSEIEKIKGKTSIVNKWLCMIELGFERIQKDWRVDAGLTKKYDEIKSVIKKYIERPQELRNKIAHGQWIIALNPKNFDENIDITKRLKNLDMVEVSIWFEVNKFLCFIIRDLVQSPKKTFEKQFQIHYDKLQNYIKKTESWNMNTKKVKLDKIKKPKISIL